MLVPVLVLCLVPLPLAFLLGLQRIGCGSEERAAVVISTVRFSARCFEILYPPVKSSDEEHLEGGIKHKLLKPHESRAYTIRTRSGSTPDQSRQHDEAGLPPRTMRLQ